MILLGLVISWYATKDIEFSVLINDLKNINPGWFFVACGCILAYFFFEAVITYILVRQSNQNFTFYDAFRVPLVEQLFNGITPFSSGGQPAQLVVLMQSGVDAGKASSALLMKFIVYQAMIVLNFIISLIIGFEFLIEKVNALAILVAFGFIIHLVVIILLLMIMYWHAFTKQLINYVMKPIKWFVKAERFDSWKATVDDKVDTFYLESVKIGHQWRLMGKIFVLTFFQLLFYYLIPYFIMRSLGYDNVNVLIVTSLNVLIFLVISMFPIPGGSGGAEYSFEMLFRSYIHSSSKLAVAMILWRILTYYVGLILGVVALVSRPSKEKKKIN